MNQAHQFNIDVAQRELDRRNAEGEDVSNLRVCQTTAQIVKVAATPAVDPDSDTARIARHRTACTAWPAGRPETHAERRLREALDYLERILNGCTNHAEQQAADTLAREFLADCGR